MHHETTNTSARKAPTNFLRLTLDLQYEPGAPMPSDRLATLVRQFQQALAAGLQGASHHSIADNGDSELRLKQRPAPLTEAKLANFMRYRLENGDLTLNDLPTRLARYGLMEPDAFVEEMSERLAYAGMADTQLRCTVRVSGDASDPEDKNIPGEYSFVANLNRAVEPQDLTTPEKSNLAAAILDCFHEHFGIEVLDDFTIQVLLPDGQEIEDDDLPDAGLVECVEHND